MGHKDTKQLLKELELLKKKVKVGDRFLHYKHSDNFYHIVAVGFIESIEEPCVVYEAEYGDKITWVRTEKEFFSTVKLPDGLEVARFTKVI